MNTSILSKKQAIVRIIFNQQQFNKVIPTLTKHDET